MTRMIPATPARSVTRSEREVFESIREAKGSDEFYCLHSVGLARHLRKSYGEADFIVIGPPGVFCLEVKGGQIKRNEGIWTIGWPRGSYESMEGPFKQSQQTIYPLMKELSERLSPEFKRKTMVGWGVIFPDVTFNMQDPEWSLDVVCDAESKSDFSSYIQRLSRHTRERELVGGRQYPESLTRRDCEQVVQCFRRDFDLVPRMGELVRDSQLELAELSERQYRVLDYALDPSNPRVFCPGAAGSGKTMIALEAARRLARENLSVLLICFNRVLGEYLRLQITADDGRIQVWPLHQFMHELIISTGFGDRLREAETQAESATDLFQNHYPELFEAAVIESVSSDAHPTFDALIIDEAQDILFSPTIDAVETVLAGGFKDGRWIFLLDPALQSEVYGRLDDHVLDTFRSFHPVTLTLTENFRNPEPVVDEICQLTGMAKPPCRRQLVSRVEYGSYVSGVEQGRKLRAILVKLMHDGVKPSQITILSGARREESCVSQFPPDIGQKVVWLNGKNVARLDAGSITACTISAFKGLENDIIILTDLPVPKTSWEKSMIYVGMTRARTSVHALITDEFLAFRF